MPRLEFLQIAQWLTGLERPVCAQMVTSSRRPVPPFCYLEQDPSYPLLGTGSKLQTRKTGKPDMTENND